MKDVESKVTPFVAPAELKARQAKVLHSSEDIHVGPNTKLSGGFATNGMLIVDGRIDDAEVTADRLLVSHIGALGGRAVVCRAKISGVFSGELPRWPGQTPPPVATPNSPRQGARIMTTRG